MPSERSARSAPIPISGGFDSGAFDVGGFDVGREPPYGGMQSSDTPLSLKDATQGGAKKEPPGASGPVAGASASLKLGPGASVEAGPGASIVVGGVLEDATVEATGVITDPPLPPRLPPTTEIRDEERRQANGSIVRASIEEEASVKDITAAGVNVQAVLEEKVGATDAYDAVVTHGPPNIPDQRSATISPDWLSDKLTIVSTAATSLMSSSDIMAALAVAKMHLNDVLASLQSSPSNVDHRLIAFVKRLADAVPNTPPDQLGVFMLGREAEALKRRVAIGMDEGELSGSLAAGLLGAAEELSECALQFPSWRQFKRNVESAALISADVETAPQLAIALANKLESDEAKEFVDASVPKALRSLATPDDPTGIIAQGADLLAYDALESIGNILKKLSGPVRAIVETAGKSGFDETLKQTDLLARRIVRWGFRGGPFVLLDYSGWFPWIAPLWEFARIVLGI
ncbi:MAG: hypothetical protein U1E23_18375 [Reyranellaceae bacterium]